MENKTRRILIIAAATAVAALTVLAVVEWLQRRPLGDRLPKPAISYSLQADPFYGLGDYDMSLISVGGVNLVTAKLEADFPGEAEDPANIPPLPGEVLDLQIPGLAETLQKQARERAATMAATGLASGQPELAAMSMNLALAQGGRRQAIAHLDPESRSIVIDATLAIDDVVAPQLAHSPSGRTLSLGSAVPNPDREVARLSLDRAFISRDGGRHWRFDPKSSTTTLIGSSSFSGQLSEDSVYFSEGHDLWIRASPERPWQRIDLLKTVWANHPQQQKGGKPSVEWMVLPRPNGVLTGWSLWTEKKYDEDGSLLHTWFREARRFEVVASEAGVARVDNVAPTDEIDTPMSFYPRDIHRAADGSALWNYSGRMLYLQPQSWRWQEIDTPDARGFSSRVLEAWVGRNALIVKVGSDTAWDRLACYLPLRAQRMRQCDAASAQAYFFSTDAGRHWRAFTLPLDIDGFSSHILGWDDVQGQLLLRRTEWNGSRSATAIDGYPLPTAASPK
ncbi:MAG: hypothetical protein QM581_07020 [Pseudomonas sp.]